MLALPTSPYRVTAPVVEALAAQSPSREALQAAVPALDAFVQGSGDAFFAPRRNRAAAMPFNGFPPGTEDHYRTAGVRSLSDTIAARTLEAEHRG